MPGKKKQTTKVYPVRTFRMKDHVYEVLREIAKHENRTIGNQLEELILRSKVGGDDRKK